MGLRSPHLLLASSNPHQMLANLRHIIDSNACDAIQSEINLNVKLLFELGESHHAFAKQLARQYWRQRISRFYYGAYNMRRAVNLHENGSFRTDIEDHKKTDLPSGFNNASTYSIRLRDLREDRNLSDYDHAAIESDLLLTQTEAETITTDFMIDAKAYLVGRGVTL